MGKKLENFYFYTLDRKVVKVYVKIVDVFVCALI